MSTQQDAYDELRCYTLALGDSAFVHQHAVDAFTAQHADEKTKPIAITFALVGLYLLVEKGFDGRQVQQVHTELARSKRAWPPFTLPSDRGSMTVVDVVAVPAGPKRDRAIRQWCASVWRAYENEHRAIADLFNPSESLRPKSSP